MSSQLKVLVIGGSGFIGQAVCNELAKQGMLITVPTRRYQSAKHLLTLPTCHIESCNIHDRATLGRLVAGQDVVINLLGVLHSKTGKPYGAQFRTHHVEFPKALCSSMLQHKVKRLIHISALGVGVQNPAPSMYLRSKTDGEAIVKDSGLAWTIIRPSVVFGPQDHFLNTFAKLSRLFPVILLAGANTRFQPVSVADVGRIIARCALDSGKDTIHNTFDAAGPEIYTLKELFELAGNAVCRKPLVLPLPKALGLAQAQLFELLPGPPLISRDNIHSMDIDNVRTGGKLFELDSYESLKTIAPEYLATRYVPSFYDKARQAASRNG